MRMFGCSGNLSAIDKYNVGDLTAHVALPMYEMPVFGFYKTAILSLEKDKLIKGNILAVQGWSVVSYSPDGEVDYILTVENDPYHKTAGGMQVNDDMLSLKLLMFKKVNMHWLQSLSHHVKSVLRYKKIESFIFTTVIYIIREMEIL